MRKIINRMLRPLHVELVKRPKAALNMNAGLARAKAHGFPVRTIIDVGASDGSWSKMAMRHFPDADVLAFEPLTERQEQLEAFKAANPRFRYVLAVAGDHEGTAPLRVADNLDGSGVAQAKIDGLRPVPMITVDAQVRDLDLRPPYLLKLDTHGFEVPILEGAARTLQESSLVVMEVYNFKLNNRCLRFHEMCGHIESLGFRPYDLADPMLRERDDALWQMDLFFARAEMPMFRHAVFR